MFDYNRIPPTQAERERDRIAGPQCAPRWVHDPHMHMTSMSRALAIAAVKAEKVPEVLATARPVFYRDVTPSEEVAKYGPHTIRGIRNLRKKMR